MITDHEPGRMFPITPMLWQLAILAKIREGFARVHYSQERDQEEWIDMGGES